MTLASFSAASLTCSHWASGSDLKSQGLLKVYRTDDPNFLNEIRLHLDDEGNLKTLGVSLEPAPVTLAQLERGFVLNKVKKGPLTIETVRLTAEKGFNLKSGGPLTLRYLKQYRLTGSNTYEELSMNLVREGGRWLLRDQHHQEFNTLRMNAHARGISEITAVNVCATAQISDWIQSVARGSFQDFSVHESLSTVNTSLFRRKVQDLGVISPLSPSASGTPQSSSARSARHVAI
jgi:hypothetical protein